MHFDCVIRWKELERRIKDLDPVLKDHVKYARDASKHGPHYLSKDIQNELIQINADKV